MTSSELKQIRQIIKEEIQNTTLPQVSGMDKFIDGLSSVNLNKNKRLAIAKKIITLLAFDKQEYNDLKTMIDNMYRQF